MDARPPASGFAADFNVFVALLVAGGTVGGVFLALPAGLLASLVLPRGQAEAAAYPLGYALLAVLLAVV